MEKSPSEISGVQKTASEAKEKKETIEPITIWLVGYNKETIIALQGAMHMYGGIQFETYSDADQLTKNLKLGKVQPDMIYLGDFLDANVEVPKEEQTVQAITQIRNDIGIKKQPCILKIGDNREVLQKYINAGADFAMQSCDILDLLQAVFSLPELINNLETQYGKKMLHNKQGFYKEYQEKLQERSGETADTEKELEILEDIFRAHGARHVLDAGMGEGRIAMPLIEKGYQVTGVDSSQDLVQRAKGKYSEGNFLAGDLRALPVKDGTQDAITYNWHVFADILGNQPKRNTLAEAYRVLRPGGVIVLDLPDRESGDVQRDGIYIHNPGGERVFIGYVPTEEEMKQFLMEAGFDKVEVKKWETRKGFHKITFVGEKTLE